MQNPFSDSFWFENPILEFLKETAAKMWFLNTVEYQLKFPTVQQCHVNKR